jgi:hypothetical protein
MKPKNFSAVGSLHPILFFAVVYVVALVLSIFICSSIFYSLNGSSSAAVSTELVQPAAPETVPVAAVAMR